MASRRSFLPDSDSKLLEWSTHFKDLLVATPTVYGMTAAQATAYSTLHTTFATALSAATAPTTRTKGTISAKDDARKNLKLLASSYGRMIVANNSVTNEQKINLGLNPRAIPQPIPAPSEAPGLEITGVVGRTVSVILYKAGATRKTGKPAGVQGASVFSYVGTTPPTDPAAYTFEGSTTLRNFQVQFPDSVPPGSTVYLCAFWFSPRMLSGPACLPQQATIQYGMSQSTGLKMAA